MPSSQSKLDNVSTTDDRTVIDDYKIWKRNVPFLYDTMMTSSLEWPSMTCQWIPNDPNQPIGVHRIILGTHTVDNALNHLMLATVTIGKSAEDEISTESKYKSQVSTGFMPVSRMKVDLKVNHEGEVNKARYMPQNSMIVATKPPSNDVLVFDCSKHSTITEGGGSCQPLLRLKGHTKEGYGLSWHPRIHGHLLSGSEDHTICLWNINSRTTERGALEPGAVFRGHTSVVEDVKWHPFHESIFASVGDDKHLLIWDTREANKRDRPSNKAEQVFTRSVEAHQREVNCVDFSPFSQHILLTGSADQTLGLWDLRNLKLKLHSFESHTDEVFNVQWSPHDETFFASGSSDRRVIIWDLCRIGDDQSGEDAEDGPPEMLFLHGGHTDKISDISWNPSRPWTIASVSEDNIIQVWEITSGIYEDDLLFEQRIAELDRKARDEEPKEDSLEM